MTSAPAGRYLTMDAMRGAAAIAVAVFHLDYGLAPHGYLAVDFFFALSGFVLARTYEGPLRAGASVRWFMTLRLARLWPLFAAGILLGTAHATQLILRGGEARQDWSLILVGLLFNSAMLPDPFSDLLYPSNNVFWSIFGELAANLAFAAVLAKLTQRGLVILAVVFAIALADMAVPPHFINSGPRWDGVPLGLVRTFFSFSVGMLIARYSSTAPRRPGIIAVLLVVLLCATTVVPELRVIGRAFDLVAIFVVLPLLLAISTRVEPLPALARLAAFMGDISYALYAVHRPIAQAALFVARRHDLSPLSVMLPFLAVSIAASALLVHFWDKPVRKRLSRFVHQRRSAMPETL